MLQRVVRTAVAAAALMAGAAIAQPRVARAATITGASIESRDGAVELRFAVQGSGLGWSLSIHGQQLWIDLARVRMEIPPRPLFGQEIEPVTMVRAIGVGGGIGGSGRITVEVSGRI